MSARQISPGSRPRVLLVASERPWPLDSGVRMRLAAVLDGLSRVADVDLFCAVVGDPAPAPPSDLPAARVCVSVGPPGLSLLRLPRWLLSPMPRTVALRKWRPHRQQLRTWIGDQRYDVAWYSDASSLLGLPCSNQVVTALDVDDIPEQVLRHRLASSDRRGFRRIADAHDANRWRKLFPPLLATLDSVSVCSELDRGRLASACTILPNGYDGGEVVVRRRGAVPVIACVGGSDYPPNDEAACFAAREVLPLVREELPTAELWVVGRVTPGSAMSKLVGLPGVRVLGRVENVSAVLADVDVVLVTVRYGGGTRIKILEAWANERPVVSTAMGAEGLELTDGVHALLADDAPGLAAACVRVLEDGQLARRLIEAGRALQRAQYTWEVTRVRVGEIIGDLMVRAPL